MARLFGANGMPDSGWTSGGPTTTKLRSTWSSQARSLRRPRTSIVHVLLVAPGLSTHSQGLLRRLLRAGCEVSFLDRHDPKPSESAGRYRFVPFPDVPGLHRAPRMLSEFLAAPIRGLLIQKIWR